MLLNVRRMFGLLGVIFVCAAGVGATGCGKKEEPQPTAPAGKAPVDPDEPMPNGGPPKKQQKRFTKALTKKLVALQESPFVSKDMNGLSFVWMLQTYGVGVVLEANYYNGNNLTTRYGFSNVQDILSFSTLEDGNGKAIKEVIAQIQAFLQKNCFDWDAKSLEVRQTCVIIENRITGCRKDPLSASGKVAAWRRLTLVRCNAAFPSLLTLFYP